MISTIIITALTAPATPFILTPLSQKTKDGISTPRKGEQSPLSLTVFLCPVISDTGLIRVAFVMVDCLRESLGFARTFAGSANLIQSATQCLAPKDGGLFSSKGVSAMNTVVQQAASSTPDTIVLNPQTFAIITRFLERAKQHTHDLVDVFSCHENDLALVEIEIEITIALNALNAQRAR